MRRLDVGIVVQRALPQLATDCRSEVIRIKFGGGHWEKEQYVLPLCLRPPNGASMFNVLTQLIQTVPALGLSPVSEAWLMSWVETAAIKAVQGVVRLTDNILLVLELDDGANGAEGLLLDDLHFRIGFCESHGLSGSDVRMSSDVTREAKRWMYLDEATLASKTPTTGVEFGSFLPDSMYDVML